MPLLLDNTRIKSVNKKITISGSKSETNRILILKQFYPNINIHNASNSNDSFAIINALKSKDKTVNIHHAGTAMRFLTSYFATQKDKDIILTGSNRMKQRPIKELVDALNSLGANIEFIEKVGFPPLKIKGTKITNQEVEINGNISSQFITSLLLIASTLENGLIITIKNELTSIPYVLMTLSILNELGIKAEYHKNKLKVYPKKEIKEIEYTIESDWSSASYFYSSLAIISHGSFQLNHFKENSLQGDSELVSIYKLLGIKTTFNLNGINLSKSENSILPKSIELDCSNFPDLAQTILVTCFAKGVPCKLTGLKTLKIKETDRIIALKNELEKFNAIINVTNESIELLNSTPLSKQKDTITIETYQDHRMAMAFAPLSFITPIKILNHTVVDKSYPSFWKDFSFNQA